MKQLAKIYIKDIAFTGIVGAYERERHEPQTIFISIALSIDATKSIETDSLEDTVDYTFLCKKVPEAIAKAKYFLIESVASAVLDICMEEKGVLCASVTVEKPHALSQAKGVVMEMSRERL
ncbi:MAG TPA: dihydroneopterin aldolase [Candidatus Saccharimonadales bacterium]|nr:dihydroneopterin aldolase [Candidatus Saccharimonadales bacterium]